ncbi:hypothetical protein G6F22_019908 [Rhizopus arrhizus]|nr:hypothetical protein G6F22_019908 [Rhizopus arrhizus]
MLEELGLDYELRRYPRDPKTLLAPPELRNVHPLGKSPVLQDGELVLAESGAILDYLADRYDTQRQLSPPAMPAEGAERIAYRYWLHYAEGSAMPPLLLTLHCRQGRAGLHWPAAAPAPGLDGTPPRRKPMVCG